MKARRQTRKFLAATSEEIQAARDALARAGAEDDFWRLVQGSQDILDEVSLFDVLRAAWDDDTKASMILMLVEENGADPNVMESGNYLGDAAWKQFGYEAGGYSPRKLEQKEPFGYLMGIEGLKAPKFANTLLQRLEKAKDVDFHHYRYETRGPSREKWGRVTKEYAYDLIFHVIGLNGTGKDQAKMTQWLVERNGVPISLNMLEEFIMDWELDIDGGMGEILLRNSSERSNELGRYFLQSVSMRRDIKVFRKAMDLDLFPPSMKGAMNEVASMHMESEEIFEMVKALKAIGHKPDKSGENMADVVGWGFDTGVGSPLFAYIVEELGVKPTEPEIIEEWKEYKSEEKERESLRANPETIPFGKMTIYNGGIVKKDMRKIIAGLRKLTAKLKSKGFGHLLYGPIVVVPDKMPGKVYNQQIGKYKDIDAAAFYYPRQDMLVMNADEFLRDVGVGMRLMAHELGHRQWYKFLDATQRNWWKGEYEERGFKVKPSIVRFILMTMNKMVPWNRDALGWEFEDWRKFNQKKFIQVLKKNQKDHGMLDVFDYAAMPPNKRKPLSFAMMSESQRKKEREEFLDIMIGRLQRMIDNFVRQAEYLNTGDDSWLPSNMKRWNRDKIERSYEKDKDSFSDEMDNMDIEMQLSRVINRFIMPPSSTTEYGQNNDKEDYAEAFGSYMSNQRMPAEIHDLFMSVHGLRKTASSLTGEMLHLATELQAIDCDSFRDSYKDLAQQYHVTTGPSKRKLKKTIDVMERRLRKECDNLKTTRGGPVKFEKLGINPDHLYSNYKEGETFLYFPHSKQYFEDDVQETHYELYARITSKLKIGAFTKEQLEIIAENNGVTIEDLKKNWKTYARVVNGHVFIVKDLGLWKGKDIISGRTAVMEDGRKVISFWGFTSRPDMMKMAKKLKADVVSLW